MSDLSLDVKMKPRKVKPHKSRTLRLPFGKGRVGFTTDPGEGNMFDTAIFETHLGAIVRGPDYSVRGQMRKGDIIEERDLGSGTVTNLGVLALAYDTQYGGAGSVLSGLVEGKPQGAAKTAFNLFALLAYHQWGTGSTAMKQENIKLETAATNKNTKSADKAVLAKNTVTASGTGTPKLISTATLESETVGELKITEWGIFTQESLKEADKGTGKFVKAKLTAESAEAEPGSYVASSDEAKGERLKIAYAEENDVPEAAFGWALITHNTTNTIFFPAWYKESDGSAFKPRETAAYKLRPVMFDRRTFGVITLEEKNKIEFPWELTVKAGG